MVELLSSGDDVVTRRVEGPAGALATGGEELGLRRETLEASEAPVPAPPGGRPGAVLRFDVVF